MGWEDACACRPDEMRAKKLYIIFCRHSTTNKQTLYSSSPFPFSSFLLHSLTVIKLQRHKQFAIVVNQLSHESMATAATRPSTSLEMRVINECTTGRKVSTSAPTPPTLTKSSSSTDEAVSRQDDDKIAHDKMLQRRSTGSRKQTRKRTKRMGSSSSLHSLVSILKPPDGSQQRSVSNVSFGQDFDMKRYEEDDTGATNGEELDIDDGSAVHAARGSLSTTQSTIGFRASFFSLLEKLGVYRSQEIYKPTIPAEARPSQDRRTNRNSITSLYFRKLYGGKNENTLQCPLSIDCLCVRPFFSVVRFNVQSRQGFNLLPKHT